MDNNEIFNYRKLIAYQRAKTLVKEVYRLLRKFPKEEQYALCDQLRRAVTSVTSNIAEGTNRSTYPDKVHFLEISYGSLMEVSSQMEVAGDLGYISTDDLSQIDELIITIAKPLSGLRSKFQEELHKP